MPERVDTPVGRPYNLCTVRSFLHVPCAIILILTLGTASHVAQARIAGPFVPASGCYLGAYIDLDPVTKGDPVAFEKLTGKRHASYLRYVGYGEPFPFQWVRELQAIGAVPQIAWEPNQGLDAVRDDEYLRGWAEACRRAGCPILLRYASEMNGTWQAYSGDPNKYIAKWRLVYRLMHQVAPNVIMIWCPFAVPRATIPSYYPGDEYVDWVGVNIYAVLYNNGNPNEPNRDDQLDQLRYVYNLYADRKPIALCEYAATHFCRAVNRKTSDFAVEKMRRMYEAIKQEFPNVVLVSWFSVDAATTGLAHNEYALSSDPQVLKAYRQIIADDYWLTTFEAGKPIGIASTASQGSRPEAAAPPRTTRPLALAGRAEPRDSEVAIVVLGAPPAALAGRVLIRAEVGPALDASAVAFYIDGQFRAITNVRPFACTMTAGYYEPGEHIIRVEVLNEPGSTIATAEASVVIAPRTSGAE